MKTRCLDWNNPGRNPAPDIQSLLQKLNILGLSQWSPAGMFAYFPLLITQCVAFPDLWTARRTSPLPSEVQM